MPETDGVYQIDTCDSTAIFDDTYMTVFDPSSACFLPVEVDEYGIVPNMGQNDNGFDCNNSGSIVNINALAGKTYKILVGQYNEGEESDGHVLTITKAPAKRRAAPKKPKKPKAPKQNTATNGTATNKPAA